jgi:transcriptional regulator with XRE-family HTH domain
MSENLRLFGERLRELRLAANLSQEGLAELAHLHRTYIGGIERGERNVSLVNIHAIADALHEPVASFFPVGPPRRLRVTASAAGVSARK